MKGALALRHSTQVPIFNDNTGTTITSAAYVQLSASVPGNASLIQASNTSSQPIRLAIGASGSEVDFFIVAAGATDVNIPVELKKGARLAAKSAKSDATTGALALNFLG